MAQRLSAVRAQRDPEVKSYHRWAGDTWTKNNTYNHGEREDYQDVRGTIERDFVYFRLAMPRTVHIKCAFSYGFDEQDTEVSWTPYYIKYPQGKQFVAYPAMIEYNEDEARYMGMKRVYDHPKLSLTIRGDEKPDGYTYQTATMEVVIPLKAGGYGVTLDFDQVPHSNFWANIDWRITAYPYHGQEGNLGEVLREEEISQHMQYDVVPGVTF